MCAAIMKNAFQQNTRRPSNAESMLAHRLRRCPNTDSTPGERPVPAGMCKKERESVWRATSRTATNGNPRAVSMVGHHPHK